MDEILEMSKVLASPAEYEEAPKAEVIETPEALREPETPPEEVTPETPEATEDEILASQEEVAEVEAEAPIKKGPDRAAEKRIAKLVKEREQLRGQLQAFQSQPQQVTQQIQQAYIDPEAPDPAQYPEGENDIDFKLDRREYQRTTQAKEAAAQAKVREAYEKYPDLVELVEADQSKTNPTMLKLIKESDITGDLFHHLMANPDESNRIAALGPIATAKEIGKLELKLQTPKPAPTKKVIPALPEPIKPVKTVTGSGPSKASKYVLY